MNLKNSKKWNNYVKKNTDPYGKACVDVARRVMEILDENSPFDPHTLICRANKDVNVAGITGFMAGCIAQMVSVCHTRGEEFRRLWNKDIGITDEDGDKANESGGVINPAILIMKAK